MWHQQKQDMQYRILYHCWICLQAAPPACSFHVLFLRTPKVTFGLTYKARDSCFETQLQHIHSLGSKLLLSQTASIPIPFSIPACV